MSVRNSGSRGAADLEILPGGEDTADRRAGEPATPQRSRARRQSQREDSARRRDATAGARDTAADVRDRAADAAQIALLAIEQERDSTIQTLLAAAVTARVRAAADRADAASDRRLAAAERANANPSDEQSRTDSQRLRDEHAGSRDRAADVRDRAAEAEDEALLIIERERESIVQGLLSAGGVIRDFAAADRAHAASDRHGAAVDRAQASTDSGEASAELEQAQRDGLTGAHRRDLGSVELELEIERSRRSDAPFALAFIDVDGLKRLNDREGHAAGDALLREIVVALRAQMRPYDPIVRVGGDEFLCGFADTTLEAARRRVEEIRAALKQGPTEASISVGLAVLGERDTLDKLIARADADMYAGKHRGRRSA